MAGERAVARRSRCQSAAPAEVQPLPKCSPCQSAAPAKVQPLPIARVILKVPGLLILGEATSHLTFLSLWIEW